MVRRLRFWMRAVLHRSSFERDMLDELQAHLERRIEALVASGLTPDAARRRARLEFGSLDTYIDRCRDVRRVTAIDDVARDLRVAARSLRRNPGFALVAVLTLALGIAATTIVFSVVYAVLFRPLPFPHADRLVHVSHLSPARNPADPPLRGGLTLPQVQAWRERATTTVAIGVYGPLFVTLTGGAVPARLPAAEVSAGVFAALGTSPLLGRTFLAEDQERDAAPVVILSHGTWRVRLGGDPDVIGGEVVLDGLPRRVVGVMPEGFDFPSVAGASVPLDSEGRYANAPEIWVPVAPDETGIRVRQAIALLRPGATPEAATAEGSLILAPSSTSGAPPGFRYAEVVPLAESAARRVRPILLLFQAGAACLFLIACANVLNLLLARAAHRRADLAVRAAIGATRWQLIRSAAAEGVLVSVAGAILGLLIAHVLVMAVRVLPPYVLPRLSEIRVDGVVLTVTLALSMATGLAVGAAAGWRSSRAAVRHAGDPQHRVAGQRPSHVLVVVQIAAAMVLLACAGLLFQSVIRLVDVKSGVQPEHVLVFRVLLPAPDYPTPELQRGFVERLADALRALPGVESAGVSMDGQVLSSSTFSSFEFVDGTSRSSPESGPAAEPDVNAFIARTVGYRRVSDDYFRTLGIPLLQGREFRATDRQARASSAVINDAFAMQHFGNVDPIGRQIAAFGYASLEIIGVAGDVRHVPTIDPGPELFLPPDDKADEFQAMLWRAGLQVVGVARTTPAPRVLVTDVRRVVSELDPRLAVYDVASLQDMLARAFVAPRFNTLVALLLAGAALALAAVGLYGLLAYSVAARQREIGMRMALGASARVVILDVVRRGSALTAAGILSGLAATLSVSHFVEALLFGITSRDVTTMVVVAVLLATVGVLACYVPARRAALIDPIAVLRSE